MSYDFKTAIATLNDNDKNRLLAIYFNSDALTSGASVNWQKATNDFGSASIESFKVCVRNSLKKVEKAMAGGDGAAATTPPSSAKGKGGRKRKAADEDAGGDDTEETPKPKAKRGRKGEKAAAEVDGEGAADGATVVKAEGEADE